MTGDQQSADITKQLPQRLDVDLALQAAGLGLWEVDLLTNQVLWDQRCGQLFGLDSPPPSYLDTLPHIHPDDVERVSQAVERALNPQSDGDYQVTYRTIGEDGRTRWIQSTGRRYVDPAGQPVRLAGVAQDVTQLVEARQQAQRQQRIAEVITASSPDLVYIFDLNYRFTYVNQAVLNMWGSSGEASIGKGLREVGYEPWHAQMNEREMAQVVATKQPVRGEVSFVHATMGRRFYDYVFAPVLNEQGEVEAVAGNARDITRQIEVRQQTKESEAKLRSIINSAPTAIGAFVGAELIVENPNQLLIDLLGHGPALEGKSLRQILSGVVEEDQTFIQIIDGVRTSGQPFDAKEVAVFFKAERRTRYFNISFVPLRDESGTLYAVLDVSVDVTEQVAVRRKLEESEARFRSLIQEAPVAMLVYEGPDMVMVEANDKMLAIFGRGEAILGKPLLESVPELVGTTLPERYRQVLATGQTHHEYAERILLLKNGQPYWGYYDYIYKALHAADGIAYGVICTAIEVTSQVLARQKLEETQRQLLASFNDSPVGIAIISQDKLTFTLANPFYGVLTGRTPQQLVGKSLLEALPELAGQGFDTLLEGVFATGVPYVAQEVAVRVMRAHQLETIYIDFTYQPQGDLGVAEPVSGMASILVVCVDVTQQVLARRKVEEQEASLRNAIELAELATWSMDVVTGQMTYSPRLQAWLGISQAVIGRDASPRVHPKDRQRVSQAMVQALAPGGAGLYDETYTITHAITGQERIIRASGQTLFDATGQARVLAGTAQDVTLQQALQGALERQVQQRTEELAATNEELAASNEELLVINEQLTQATQLLSRSNENLQKFAYVASHDLQEPLRKIQSFGDLLKDRYANQLGDGIDYLERMQVSAGRMSTLIKDLLAYSRISIQKESNDTVSLTDVVQLALTDLELAIQETGAIIRVDPLPAVLGDAGQLNQLFQNLLSNALKFRRVNPAGLAVHPEIQVRADWLAAGNLPLNVKPARGSAAYHRIEVSDNGIGFNEKYLDRIFQVFQRLHGKNEYAGTGIGLAICEKVVVNHGGAITASSQVGQGASFTVYLPM